jgi:demethylmenaquinone methyltransferase/2-methoxy-6-polyprenyl-1,4-benzoquinol methylase
MSDPDKPPAGPVPEPIRPHPELAGYYASESERRRRLDSWFDTSADRYESITQRMSFGSGHWYRRRVLARLGVPPGSRVLDVACGTGVVAEAARRVVGAGGSVVALDASLGMLRTAAPRAPRRVRALAERLPFPDASFDLVTMGYALRHVTDLRVTFAEFRRVLRRGGRAVVLELTSPRSRTARGALRLYLRGFVPAMARLGRHGAAARELMTYYWDTIEACVPPETILGAMRDSGFTSAQRQVDLGIFSEYRAEAG